MSLLEALAYGNAVLCSDIPENTSVAEDRAVYFKKSDVDDLAEKLQTLCNDSEKVAELKNGVDEFILSRYNWKDIAVKTSNLYKNIAKG